MNVCSLFVHYDRSTSSIDVSYLKDHEKGFTLSNSVMERYEHQNNDPVCGISTKIIMCMEISKSSIKIS